MSRGAEEPGCRGAGEKESCIPGAIETFAWFGHEVVIHRASRNRCLCSLPVTPLQVYSPGAEGSRAWAPPPLRESVNHTLHLVLRLFLAFKDISNRWQMVSLHHCSYLSLYENTT